MSPTRDPEGGSSHLSVSALCLLPLTHPPFFFFFFFHPPFPRFAQYYRDLTGAERRTLIKAYGIRFDIIVFGKVAWPPAPVRALVQT